MIAHVKPGSPPVIQPIEDHRKNVAELAARFAAAFGCESLGYILGWFHDKGKERDTFQNYIRLANGLAPISNLTGAHEHAYIGGIMIHQLLHSPLLANAVMGHHRGLYDADVLREELKKTLPREIKREPLPRQPRASQQQPLDTEFHHFLRMFFSCLVDADFLDTEHFMQPEQAQLRGQGEKLPALLAKLEAHLAKLKTISADTEVNRVRDFVQQLCRERSNRPCGFYSMTVPTGGGKTLASLLWALRHAIHNGQKRVIIAIPYTSIIVQTAATLKSILGENNVLEHHSNVEFNVDEEDEEVKSVQLAMENWDYPIVVTTNVQLFESMFANKPSACRKLHNIANSVLILDEVQTLPTQFLQPIIDALKSYNRLFGVSVLFTTASQPVLNGLIEGCNPAAMFEGIDKITEIIPPESRLHEKLRRVKLDISETPQSYDDIAKSLCLHKRVLCVVNTRRDAREIFKRLPNEGITLHLSRMMCPAHVNETIDEIKDALKNNACGTIRVVATQLVEAGVDIDFPVVYRQEAGLDSVLQAAGRCNREGKLDMGVTYVFSLAKEHPLPKGDISDANNARLALKGVNDWFSPQTMTLYFKQLYCRKDSFDTKRIGDYLYNPLNILFETAAREFKLIENEGYSVIVKWKNHNDELIEQLKKYGPCYSLMKKLAKYSINIHKYDFDALLKIGVVKEVAQGVFLVDYQLQYDDRLGLLTDNQWDDKILMK